MNGWKVERMVMLTQTIRKTVAHQLQQGYRIRCDLPSITLDGSNSLWGASGSNRCLFVELARQRWQKMHSVDSFDRISAVVTAGDGRRYTLYR